MRDADVGYRMWVAGFVCVMESTFVECRVWDEGSRTVMWEAGCRVHDGGSGMWDWDAGQRQERQEKQGMPSPSTLKGQRSFLRPGRQHRDNPPSHPIPPWWGEGRVTLWCLGVPGQSPLGVPGQCQALCPLAAGHSWCIPAQPSGNNPGALRGCGGRLNILVVNGV